MKPRSHRAAISALVGCALALAATNATARPTDAADPFQPENPTLLRRGTLGVEVGGWDLTLGGINLLGVPDDGPAHRAGLRTGDRVFAINDQAITTREELLAALRTIGVGQTANLLIARGQERLTIPVTLGPRALQLDGVDVTYGEAQTENGYAVRTILMTPADANANTPRSAVMFIQGIPCASIDMPSPADRGLAKCIQDIARAGHIVLLVEKPGVGDSAGPSCEEYGFHEEMQAYRAGLHALRGHPLVDPQRIFLVGISLGGLQAPLLAVEVPEDGSPGVAGVAVFGTGFVPWTEYMVSNVRRQVMISGASPAEANQVADAYARYWSLLLHTDMTPAQIMEMHPDLAAYGFTDSNTVTAGRSVKFFRELHDSNWSMAWSVISSHVLAMHGSMDFVCDRRDHEWIVQSANESVPGRARFISLEGMSHGMTVWDSELQAMTTGLGNGRPSDLATSALLDFVQRVGEDLKAP